MTRNAVNEGTGAASLAGRLYEGFAAAATSGDEPELPPGPRAAFLA